MHVKMLAMFGIGASVGYTAHRAPAPAAAAVAPQPVAAPITVERPPAPQIVVVQAPTPPPRLVPRGEPEAEAEAPAAQDQAAEPEATGSAEEPAPKGVIAGTVSDAHTGDRLYRVYIVAESKVSETMRTYSEEDGSYRLEGLPSASYTLHFYRYGELPAERTAGVSQLDATRVDVAMQPTE